MNQRRFDSRSNTVQKCIFSPSALNRFGGNPFVSNNACKCPTSVSSLSESGCGGTAALLELIFDVPALLLDVCWDSKCTLETSSGDDVVGVWSGLFNLTVGFVLSESLLRDPSLAMAACDVDGSVAVAASNAIDVDAKPPLDDEPFLPIGAVPSWRECDCDVLADVLTQEPVVAVDDVP